MNSNGAIHSKLTRNEIIQELEEASRKYFHCGLVEFIQQLEANSLPDNKEFIKGDMQAWLGLLSADDKIFKQAHGQLNSVA